MRISQNKSVRKGSQVSSLTSGKVKAMSAMKCNHVDYGLIQAGTYNFNYQYSLRNNFKATVKEFNTAEFPVL